jgi:SAM-dependent methyltransferase
MTKLEECQGAKIRANHPASRDGQYQTTDWEVIRHRHARINRSGYPRLDGYGWDAIYQALHPGQRVLDLGCGRAASSLYLAREFAVRVVAADLWIAPSENWPLIEEAGLQDLVFPLHVDARKLPFASGYFDALLCMDSYFYYGTDDFFLRSLAKHFKAGAVLCIGGPCYRDVFVPHDSVLFNFGDAVGYHSPLWWKEHFEQSGVVEDVTSVEHPLGAELWEDYVLYSMENAGDDPDVRHDVDKDIKLIEANHERMLTHFILTARRSA